MDDSPLYVFRSPAGRIFLSAVHPPKEFSDSGNVSRVGSFGILDERRAIPGANWHDEGAAVLFQRPGTHDYLVGFADQPTPEGYERIGSDFAFVIDEWNLRRAMALDSAGA